MIININKHYFDIQESGIIIDLANIEFNNKNIYLKIGGDIHLIKEYIKYVNKECGVVTKLSIPNNIKIDNYDKVKLIIKDNNHTQNSSRKKVVIDLVYTPNIIKNYSDFWLHRVAKDETLSDISKKYYNTSSLSNKIYEVNIDRIDNTNSIIEGQILRIPRGI